MKMTSVGPLKDVITHFFRAQRIATRVNPLKNLSNCFVSASNRITTKSFTKDSQMSCLPGQYESRRKQCANVPTGSFVFKS
jgi:hypothetical protein